jgi:hypothetical protein
VPTLDNSELAAINSGLPDLHRLGPHLLVPFDVETLPAATVVWLNDRWFSRQGVPLSRDGARRLRAETWILEEFAVTTPTHGAAPGAVRRLVHADRYGDPRGTSPHGGSGRVATIGRFQVKGIGPTPLVGDATWIHSHGHVSLSEAIAEAMYGELLDQELPYGAVPVIAIVDTGEHMVSSEQTTPRALIVRPAVVRPAHFLRAPLFVGSQRETLAPSSDARRTRESVQWLASLHEDERDRLRLPLTLAQMQMRFATQAAIADSLRVYTGGLFAQNLSLDGAVLDFGVARTLYSWVNMQLHAHAQGFGRDLDRLANCAIALQFYARKAGCEGSGWFATACSAEELRKVYREAQDGIFGRFWTDSALEPAVRDRIRSATRKYFERQQQLTFRERWDGRKPRQKWIYDALTRGCTPADDHAEESEWLLISEVIDGIDSSRNVRGVPSTHIWRNAARLFRPRAELDRARLDRRIARLLRVSESHERAARISRLIENSISRCRRWWEFLPAELAVVSQRVRMGCSALEVVTAQNSQARWWLEGDRCGDRLTWGRSVLSESEQETLTPVIDAKRWSALTASAALPSSLECEIRSMRALNYGNPPSWWPAEALTA